MCFQIFIPHLPNYLRLRPKFLRICKGSGAIWFLRMPGSDSQTPPPEKDLKFFKKGIDSRGLAVGEEGLSRSLNPLKRAVAPVNWNSTKNFVNERMLIYQCMHMHMLCSSFWPAISIGSINFKSFQCVTGFCLFSQFGAIMGALFITGNEKLIRSIFTVRINSVGVFSSDESSSPFP